MQTAEYRRKYKNWTQELSDQFRLEWGRLQSDEEIGKLFGITAGAARRRRQYLGILVGSPHPVKQRKWTPEMDSVLREMRGQSSAALIADRLNVTRSSVIGRAFRLGLPKLKTGGVPNSNRRPKAQQKPTLRNRLRLVVDNTVEIEDEAIPAEQRRTLLELSESTCRWPVGDPEKPDFFFCGSQPIAGCPYCASHAIRAYQVGRCA